VEFRCFRPGAQRVEVIGSFTGWQSRPLELRNAGNGWWIGGLILPPGDYEFQYRIDGTEVIADYAAGGVLFDRHAGWKSLLFVEDRPNVEMPADWDAGLRGEAGGVLAAA